MLEKLTAARLPVLLVGMLAPPNLGQQYEQSFNAIYPELAEQLGRSNRLSLPRLEKVVLNMGVGSAIMVTEICMVRARP